LAAQSGDKGAVPPRQVTAWSIFFDYIRKRAPGYALAVTLIVASSQAAVWIPRWIGRFTDQLSQGRLEMRQAAHYAWVLLAVAGLRVTSLWVGRLYINVHGRRLVYELRARLLAKWSTLTPSYYQRHSVGDLLSHALSDVEVIRQFASMGLSQSMNCLSLLASAFYVMAVHMDWRLMLAGLLPLFFIPVIMRGFGPKIKAQSVRYQEALGRMSQTVEEDVGAIRTIKAFGNESILQQRFEERLHSIVAEKARFVRLSALFSALIPLQASIGFIVVMWYGSSLAIQGRITLGDFVAFLLYLNLLRMPLEQLGQILNVFQRASGSLGRLAQLLSVRPDVADHAETTGLPRLAGDVEFRNLTFTYPGSDKPALQGVSLSLKSGRTLGIVGGIGAGKTTLANLLLRLYDPPEGSLWIDGVDVRRIPLAELRQAIAYVPQNGFLFSATLSENIGFSEREPDAERIELAAKDAGVYDDINDFPESFSTEIGERGVRLSGGQKQRVAIARMAYKGAAIRILDDSLSAVDTKTEQVILRNLHRDAQSDSSHTTLIISHRLSAVRHADEVIVLDAGRVTERGTHDQLLERGGVYARMWWMQAGGSRVVAPNSEPGRKQEDTARSVLEEEEEAAGLKEEVNPS
jgi:ATP-binding cassette subfamily B protein